MWFSRNMNLRVSIGYCYDGRGLFGCHRLIPELFLMVLYICFFCSAAVFSVGKFPHGAYTEELPEREIINYYRFILIF